MADELAKKGQFKVGFGVGLAQKKANALNEAIEKGEVDPRTIATKKPEDMTNRIGIIFDDSGSMGEEGMKDAKEGTTEFLRCCNPKDTSVAIYTLDGKKYSLCTTLPALAQLIQPLKAVASTPLNFVSSDMMKKENVNRLIIFSDGAPTDGNVGSEAMQAMVALAVEKQIPVDTVFIASWESDNNYLQRVAELTGGIYLRFERGKTTFKNSFKYLAPGTRALLMDEATRKKVERGETI